MGKVCGRVLTVYERFSEYGYWKQAIVTILIGAILSIGALYGFYQVCRWTIPVGILAVVGVTSAFRGRKQFLSPSSIRLQATLYLAVQGMRQVRERNTIQMVRNMIERRPFLGAVAAPILCLLAFPIVTAAVTRFLQEFSATSGVDKTLWIVHATVTGFSFIVLVFFWEFLGDEFDNEVFIRTAVRYTWSLHIIYFLLAANIVIGVLAVPSQGGQIMSFVGVQAVLFVLSMFGVYWIYDTIYTVMVKESLTPRIKRRLEQQIGIILLEADQDAWILVVNDQLGRDYPQFALPDSSGEQERMTAGDLGLNGEVTDIHLHRLHDLFDEASALNVDIERLPVLGQSYHDDEILFVCQGDLTLCEGERLQHRLRRAVKVI